MLYKQHICIKTCRKWLEFRHLCINNGVQLFITSKLCCMILRYVVILKCFPQLFYQLILSHIIYYISPKNFRSVDTAPHCILYFSHKISTARTAPHCLTDCVTLWGSANIFDASLAPHNVHACPIFITHLWARVTGVDKNIVGAGDVGIGFPYLRRLDI